MPDSQLTQFPRATRALSPVKMAALIASMTAGGWLVVSPTQRLADLIARFDAFVARQEVRDAAQDRRMVEIKEASDMELRALRDDVRALLIGQCVAASRARDATMIEVLKCSARSAR